MRKLTWVLVLSIIAINLFSQVNADEAAYLNFDYVELQGKQALELFLNKKFEEIKSQSPLVAGVYWEFAPTNGDQYNSEGFFAAPFGFDILSTQENQLNFRGKLTYDVGSLKSDGNTVDTQIPMKLRNVLQLNAGVFEEDKFDINIWYKSGAYLDYTKPDSGLPYTEQAISRLGASALINLEFLTAGIDYVEYLKSYELAINIGDAGINGFHNHLGFEYEPVNVFASYGYDNLHQEHFGSLNVSDQSFVFLGSMEWTANTNFFDNISLTFSPINLFFEDDSWIYGQYLGIGYTKNTSHARNFEGIIVSSAFIVDAGTLAFAEINYLFGLLPFNSYSDEVYGYIRMSVGFRLDKMF